MSYFLNLLKSFSELRVVGESGDRLPVAPSLVRQALISLGATGACRTNTWCNRQPVVRFTHDSQFTETLELLKLAITTSPSPPSSTLLSTLQNICSSTSPSCSYTPSYSPGTSTNLPNASALTKKEFKLLSNLITSKAPCNLLIFGLDPQYLELSKANAEGITVFLEDDSNKINAVKRKSNRTQIYKVDYQRPAKDAYKLLKHARQNPACAPRSELLPSSKCKLTLKDLPQEVFKHKWDVIVVDGPRGDMLEAPGRMSTIYTASMLARNGETTNVVVHDVDRTIEKWFSWEFLCEENLVSSKGKLWNFRLTDQSNSTRFCPAETFS
ncbi:polysacc synt 4 domain-containing protein [Citrus sinensis]|uniref:Polysacc synt 4 domain-containing protein n=1 Tax=Citrus sinensis TaxID=2711 RepID=A0ACB8L957_CITSI|nr:polysacc synt 4 domain-containing protein [Citrus sinensis]